MLSRIYRTEKTFCAENTHQTIEINALLRRWSFVTIRATTTKANEEEGFHCGSFYRLITYLKVIWC